MPCDAKKVALVLERQTSRDLMITSTSDQILRSLLARAHAMRRKEGRVRIRAADLPRSNDYINKRSDSSLAARTRTCHAQNRRRGKSSIPHLVSGIRYPASFPPSEKFSKKNLQSCPEQEVRLSSIQTKQKSTWKPD
jgi:hypothetical protein